MAPYHSQCYLCEFERNSLISLSEPLTSAPNAHLQYDKVMFVKAAFRRHLNIRLIADVNRKEKVPDFLQKGYFTKQPLMWMLPRTQHG